MLLNKIKIRLLINEILYQIGIMIDKTTERENKCSERLNLSRMSFISILFDIQNKGSK
jgi:hypothetical protein